MIYIYILYNIYIYDIYIYIYVYIYIFVETSMLAIWHFRPSVEMSLQEDRTEKPRSPLGRPSKKKCVADFIDRRRRVVGAGWIFFGLGVC